MIVSMNLHPHPFNEPGWYSCFCESKSDSGRFLTELIEVFCLVCKKQLCETCVDDHHEENCFVNMIAGDK